MDGSITSKSGLDGLSVKFDASAKPILSVDVEKYQAYLDGTNMTSAQKEEFLQNLWQIIVSFVDLGFGVHPLQDACGKHAQKMKARVENGFWVFRAPVGYKYVPAPTGGGKVLVPMTFLRRWSAMRSKALPPGILPRRPRCSAF